MLKVRMASSVAAAACAALVFGCSVGRADHVCDALGDEGWRTLPSHETTGVVDGTPYRVEGSDNWFVDRTTTVLPLCNYFNAVGNYSLRSYSLAPVDTKERLVICRVAQGSTTAVPPYSGPCPPK